MVHSSCDYLCVITRIACDLCNSNSNKYHCRFNFHIEPVKNNYSRISSRFLNQHYYSSAVWAELGLNASANKNWLRCSPRLLRSCFLVRLLSCDTWGFSTDREWDVVGSWVDCNKIMDVLPQIRNVDVKLLRLDFWSFNVINWKENIIIGVIRLDVSVLLKDKQEFFVVSQTDACNLFYAVWKWNKLHFTGVDVPYSDLMT